MDILLYGKLYIYFVRNVYQSNIIIGIEFYINTTKSDQSLINGLDRLHLLTQNKLFIDNNNNNIKHQLRLHDKKYMCQISLLINTQNKIILQNLSDIEYDKIKKYDNNYLLIPYYSVGKNKTITKIMDIISNQ